MTTVQAAYDTANVVHQDNDCDVCEVGNSPHIVVQQFKPVHQTKLIDLIVLSVLVGGLGFLAGLYVAWQPEPYERIYRDYNHLKMYEDGSYVGEDRKGVPVFGCLPSAQCND